MGQDAVQTRGDTPRLHVQIISGLALAVHSRYRLRWPFSESSSLDVII